MKLLDPISIEEREVIYKTIEKEIRIDGRKRLEKRKNIIETDFLLTASGSCKIKKEQMEITASVNLEISETIEEFLSFKVSIKKQKEEKKEKEIESFLLDLFSDCIDKNYLKINSSTGWVFNVGVLVIENSGGMLDSIIEACRISLLETSIPHVSICEDQFIIEENSFFKLEPCSIPSFILLYGVKDLFVIDPLKIEEECSESILVISLDKNFLIKKIRKLFGGYLNMTQGMLDIIKRIAKNN